MLLKSVAVALLLSSVCCYAGTCPEDFDGAAKTRDVLDKIGHPHDWHFIIVCSDSDWQFLLRHFGEQRTAALGATSLINRTTWFKSDIFANPSGESGYVHVILHEVGHIRCQCKSDMMADRLASEMFREVNEVELAQNRLAREREQVPEREPDVADRKSPRVSSVATPVNRKTCNAPTCAAFGLK